MPLMIPVLPRASTPPEVAGILRKSHSTSLTFNEVFLMSRATSLIGAKRQKWASFRCVTTLCQSQMNMSSSPQWSCRLPILVPASTGKPVANLVFLYTCTCTPSMCSIITRYRSVFVNDRLSLWGIFGNPRTFR